MIYSMASLGIFVLFSYFGVMETGVLKPPTSNHEFHNHRPKRVLSPNIAEPLSKPWSVFLNTTEYRCGGFLLDVKSLNLSHSMYLPPENSSDVIVTAAHCVLKRNVSMYTAIGPREVLAHFGVHNPYAKNADFPLTRISANIITHEHFETRFRAKYDMAVIQLSEPVIFGDYAQPLSISTEPANNSGNCTLSGWGFNPNMTSKTFVFPTKDCRFWQFVPFKHLTMGENGNGVLSTTGIHNYHVIDGTGHVYAATSNDTFAEHGDSGSAVVCEFGGKVFAQGILSQGYPNKVFVEYADLYSAKSWLERSITELYKGTIFHPQLQNYLRYGMHNGWKLFLDVEYIFENFMGSLPDRLHEKFDSGEIDYSRLWLDNKLQDYVVVEQDVLNAHDIIGHSIEKNVYHCAAACFSTNSHGSCNYIVALSYCVYSTSRKSCAEAPCIPYGYNESVRIYFHESLISKKAYLVRNSTAQKQPQTAETHSAEDDERKLIGIYSLQAYVSYEFGESHVCLVTLTSSSDGFFDTVLASSVCIAQMIHPYTWDEYPFDDAFHLNVNFNSTITHRIPVVFRREFVDARHPSIYHLAMNMSENLPLQVDGETSFGGYNNYHQNPVPVSYNPYTGGTKSAPFERPWMVYLNKKKQAACQGVFIIDQHMKNTTLSFSHILTTAECANKLTIYESGARFGVHLSTMESLYEQKAFVTTIEIHPEYGRVEGRMENNIAMITVGRQITLNKAVQPISLHKKLIDDSESRLSAFGWNINCHHEKILQRIQFSFLEDNSDSPRLINARPKYGSAEQCNLQHHTGRPLMRCNDESGECALLGLSSEIRSIPNGETVESFTIVEPYLPWIRNAMKNSLKWF